MIDTLKELCQLAAPSGREGRVADYILERIPLGCEVSCDKMGNITVFKKGKNQAKIKVMLDAHMDEVGFIVTYITDDGLLKFTTVGGVDGSVIIGRRVVFENGIYGIIGAKPVHLMSGDEGKKVPKIDSMYIDIGASSKNEVQENISLGDMAVFDCDFAALGDEKIKAKAIDDRAGCAVLLSLLNEELEYDMYFNFSVQEEIGLRGAATAAYAIAPDSAIVVEATTAADYRGVAGEKQVCRLGAGAALSFMDGATLYDKDYFDAAMSAAKQAGIPVQAKSAVAGGNNAGAIHKSRGGVRTLAVSVPCRYIHTASCIADTRDIKAVADLVRLMAERIASGTLDG